MPNHVIYDSLWLSDRLAKCSRAAALAYPWIFLVADDHGRFEYHPRRIWRMVFGYREDVTLEEVAAWLDEYWRVGLLVRYHVSGELAYWYKFRGRRPSERRPSDHLDPKDLRPYPLPAAEEPRPDRGNVATSSRQRRDEPAAEPRFERCSETDTPAPEKSREELRSEKSRSDGAPFPPAIRPVDDRGPRKNPLLDTTEKRQAFERECLRLVGEIAELTGEGPETVLALGSEWNARRKTNPAGMSDDRLLNTVLDLRKRKVEVHEQARRKAGAGMTTEESLRARGIRIGEEAQLERRAAVGGAGPSGASAPGPSEGARSAGAARSDPGADGEAGEAQERAPPAERAGVERADAGAAGSGQGDHERREPRGVRAT